MISLHYLPYLFPERDRNFHLVPLWRPKRQTDVNSTAFSEEQVKSSKDLSPVHRLAIKISHHFNGRVTFSGVKSGWQAVLRCLAWLSCGGLGLSVLEMCCVERAAVYFYFQNEFKEHEQKSSGGL